MNFLYTRNSGDIMASIKKFNFLSISKFDDDVQKIEFNSKGYVDKENGTIYFKNEGIAYKFILSNTLIVSVKDSKYEFDLNKKTLAYICTEGMSFETSVITNRLEIKDNQITIEYKMDFSSFTGEYTIILNWH